jgi:hypothetical protein
MNHKSNHNDKRINGMKYRALEELHCFWYGTCMTEYKEK